MEETEDPVEEHFEATSLSTGSSMIGSFDDSEDYFLKYNTTTGSQSFILAQFQNQTAIFIITGIFLGYIKAIIDAALTLGRSNDKIIGDPTAIKGLIYAFDLFYFTDLICMVIYKNMNWEGLSVRYKSRHGLILFLEFVSVIPLEGIYTTMIKEANAYVYYCLRLRYALRWCRLYSFFAQIRNYVDVNSHILHFVVYMSVVFNAMVTLGCISYVVECRMGNLECDELQASHDLIGQHIYCASCKMLMTGIMTMIKSSIMNNVLASLIPYILVIQFLSYFTIDVLQTLHGRFRHLNMLTWLISRIEEWKARYKKDWTNYFVKYEALIHQSNEITWAKTRGYRANFYIGTVIPPIMYRELQMDISWVPLKHSHLFRNEDIFFLRAVASLMQHKYVCPGEVIYKRNKFKTEMVYVKSGIVVVLSEEDGETPIFSLTSGTCLGESTLFISSLSSCTVIAKDTCELAVLNRKDFIRVSGKFPTKVMKINKRVHSRYAYAKKFRSLSLYQMKRFRTDERIGIMTMKWVKVTLRKILFNQTRFENLYDRNHLQDIEMNIFCAKYLDLLVKAEDIQLVTDSVFLRNKFPFIFKPNSALLKTWNTLVLVIVLLLGLSFPYFAVFLDQLPFSYTAFYNVVTFMWFIDLYLRSSTAIQIEHTYIINIGEIIVHNLTDVSYIIDIISVLPAELLVYAIDGNLDTFTALIAQCNRLFKLYRLEMFFQNLHIKVSTHVFMLYVKFLVYFSLIIYYIAAVLYILGDSVENVEHFAALLKHFNVASTFEKFLVCLTQSVCYVASLCVSPFPFMHDWESCTVLIFLQFGMAAFNLFFTAHTAAGHSLMQQHEHQKFEFFRNLDVTMKCFNLKKQLQARVWSYVNLQFQAHGIYFLTGANLLDPIPRDLAIITCGIEIGELIKYHLLFVDVNDRVVRRICSIASIHLLPATETIKNVGEICREIHFLTNGICAITAIDSDTKTVYPGECFSLLESALNIPSMVTVQAVTTCRIISINYAKLRAIFLHYPEEYEALQRTLQNFEFLKSVGKLLSNQPLIVTDDIKAPKQYNIRSFGYILKKRTKKYFTYHEGFPKWAVIFKYLLLRYTFYCNGRFVFAWEISRAVAALITNLLFPFLALYKEDETGLHLQFLISCLDLFAFVDVYIRHHFTYFNEIGLEVSHPFLTAKYYWRHSFIIDLLGCLPLMRFTKFFITPHVHVALYLNKLLQLYRYSALYDGIFKDAMRYKGAITMLSFLPYFIIVYNIVSALTFLTFCEVDLERVNCHEQTWINEMLSKYNLNKFDAYTFSILFTVGGGAVNSFKLINVSTLKEICWLCFLVVVSMVTHLFIISNIVSVSLTINRDLNNYQEAMHNLVKFLGYRKIEKCIKKEIVNHFEYMWYKTRGKSIHTSFLPFKSSFKVEALYNIYGTVFETSTIFPAPNSSFFKSLLLDVKHEIYLKTGILYSVNDVHGDIFILLKGRVEVVGADLNKLLTMRVGSVFGNLDNCPKGRRTLSMVASGHVEVLKFSSTVFHEHLKKFPQLRRHFMTLTVFNVDFLEEKSVLSKADKRPLFEIGMAAPARQLRRTSLLRIRHLDQKRRIKIFSRNKLIKFWENVILNILYFVDYALQLYSISMQMRDLIFTLTLYSIDLLHIVKMYIKFHTSFEDEFGRVVRSPKEIAKHYIREKLGFYFDLATVVPIELVCLFFLQTPHYGLIWAICRCNRLLRIIMLLVYLQAYTEKLNINVFTIKTTFVLTKILVAQITLGSFVELMRSKHPDNTLSRIDSYSTSLMLITHACWKFSFDMSFITVNMYTVLISVFIILLCRYISWYFLGEGCAILYTVNQTRSNYEQFFQFMKRYMNNEDVSTPLSERIRQYIELLWIHKRGILFPLLLEEAPYYLKEAVLNSMFGYHLSRHYLLQHCHKDLARQMTSYMKTLVFFPGDMIVYAGDIDGCMYFIHHGEIHVLSEDTLYSEVIDCVLSNGDMFGLDQGLYERCGHEFTYKVVKYSVLVSLHRNDWIYLLDFFPASKSVIYDRTVIINESNLIN